jgi:hypothetical protein
METQVEADVNWLTWRFEATDEAGEIIFELPFAECVDVKGKPN